MFEALQQLFCYAAINISTFFFHIWIIKGKCRKKFLFLEWEENYYMKSQGRGESFHFWAKCYLWKLAFNGINNKKARKKCNKKLLKHQVSATSKPEYERVHYRRYSAMQILSKTYSASNLLSTFSKIKAELLVKEGIDCSGFLRVN